MRSYGAAVGMLFHGHCFRESRYKIIVKKKVNAVHKNYFPTGEAGNRVLIETY
jgi:hypothetical protein